MKVINAWESSVESEETDSLVMIQANVDGWKRPTMILATYDSDQIDVDVSSFAGLSVYQVRRLLQKKVGKYFKLMDLLENPGG